MRDIKWLLRVFLSLPFMFPPLSLFHPLSHSWFCAELSIHSLPLPMCVLWTPQTVLLKGRVIKRPFMQARSLWWGCHFVQCSALSRGNFRQAWPHPHRQTDRQIVRYGAFSYLTHQFIQISKIISLSFQAFWKLWDPTFADPQLAADLCVVLSSASAKMMTFTLKAKAQKLVVITLGSHTFWYMKVICVNWSCSVSKQLSLDLVILWEETTLASAFVRPPPMQRPNQNFC